MPQQKPEALLPLTPEQQTLIEENIRLAVWYSRRLSGALGLRGWLRQEVYSACLDGLFRAAQGWDPQKSKFSPYAYRWMSNHAARILQFWQNRPVPLSQICARDGRPLEPAAPQAPEPREKPRIPLGHLCPRWQEVLELRFVKGLKHREIAEILGLKTPQASSEIQRKALARLREVMEEKA